MTGGETLHAALTALPTDAGLKVSQDAADEGDTFPFIIFRRVAVERIKGISGELLVTRETFHVECWGETRAQSNVLEAQSIAAINAAGMYPDGNEVDGLDPDVKVRAAVFAVDIWF